MDRYVFFNTNSAEVVHSRDYSGSSDTMNLALESYGLLQITDFNLKSIFRDKLFCFAKDPYYPLAVTLEFSEDSTNEEDGHQFAVSMLQLFIQQFGQVLNGKFSSNSFKTYKKSLQMLIGQYLELIMEKIADDTKANFLYLSFIRNSEKNNETVSHKEKSFLLSPFSSANTDLSGIEKASQSFKQKYPFVMGKDQSVHSPKQVFCRLYSKENAISPQIVNIVNASAAIANEMLQYEKDELQTINFCFNRSEIQVIMYEEMLLVVSADCFVSIKSQIKQLYSWAKLLVV
jgi:hypothetical protein